MDLISSLLADPDFNAEFMSALKEAVKLEAKEQKDKDVDVERLGVLQSVYERLPKVLGEVDGLKLEIGLMSGVDAIVDRISLDQQGLQAFCNVLDDCGTVSIVPRVDGRLNLSVGFIGLFRE